MSIDTLIERLREFAKATCGTVTAANGEQLTYEDSVIWLAADRLASTQAEILRLKAALEELANAKALKGVRELVAGWNGEYRTDGPYERHRSELGATLPPTNCGAVYELDAAMVAANKLLFETRHSGRSLSLDGEGKP